MTSLAILHEITAIVPLPIVYYALDYSNFRIPVPEQAVAEGNRIMNKVRTRYGYEPLDPNNRVMVNLATSYAVVKVTTKKKTKPFNVKKIITHLLNWPYFSGYASVTDRCVGSTDPVYGRAIYWTYRCLSDKGVSQIKYR